MEQWRFIFTFSDGQSEIRDRSFRLEQIPFTLPPEPTRRADVVVGIRLSDGFTFVFKNRWGSKGKVCSGGRGRGRGNLAAT